MKDSTCFLHLSTKLQVLKIFFLKTITHLYTKCNSVFSAETHTLLYFHNSLCINKEDVHIFAT